MPFQALSIEVVLTGAPKDPRNPRFSGTQRDRNTPQSPGNFYPVAPREYDSRGDDVPLPEAPPEILSPTTPGLIQMEPDFETESDPLTGRRAARAAATQALYEAESTGHPAGHCPPDPVEVCTTRFPWCRTPSKQESDP